MDMDLRSFVRWLEQGGELVRLSQELSPQYEVAAALKLMAQSRGKAVLFERVKGYNVPIVGGLMGTRSRLAMAFGVEEAEMDETYSSRRQRPLDPQRVTDAPVREVVIDKHIDVLQVMPVLTHHAKDSGPYLDTGITMARDPETGVQSMSLYRIQVKDKDTLLLNIATPPLSLFLHKAEQMNKPLAIAVVVGADPLTFFAACQSAPLGVAKLALAGGFAQKPIEVVNGLSVNVDVPAHAEFVLEGHIVPRVREHEGPFGESTGYYHSENNPRAKIQLITHRRNPMYHALMPFTGEEDVLISTSWQVDALKQLQNQMPYVQKVAFRALGEITIVQIRKESEEAPKKVIEALFAQPMPKFVIVVDEDIDINDPRQLDVAVATRVFPDKDVIIRDDMPGVMIDPGTSPGERREDGWLVARTAKIGIDATKPLAERNRFELIDVPPEVKARVLRLIQGYVSSSPGGNQ